MTITRGFGFWVVVTIAILNVAAGIFASLTSEPLHAFLHGAAAVGFGLWARYLRQPAIPGDAQPEKVELLQEDAGDLQRQRDTQALLDFDEQLRRPSRDQ